MKKNIKKMQPIPHIEKTIDREIVLFQWCIGESIAHLAREYALKYHTMYRLIKSD